MSEDLTSDQTLQKYIDKMGKELGTPFYHLWQEVSWIYSKIEQFAILFARKPTRIDIMNESAPYFFRIVEDLLLENIILSIARITDPPNKFGNKNLSIQMFPSLVSEDGFRSQVKNLVDISLGKVNFCRDWRNKRLAHLDLTLAIMEGIQPLDKITLNKLNDAIDSIADVLNIIDGYYCNSTTYFKLTGDVPGNSKSLLYVLYAGLKAKKERIERMKNGNPREDDFNHQEI